MDLEVAKENEIRAKKKENSCANHDAHSLLQVSFSFITTQTSDDQVPVEWGWSLHSMDKQILSWADDEHTWGLNFEPCTHPPKLNALIFSNIGV